MIEIRTTPTPQRWTGSGWRNVGGQVIAAVDAASLEGADLQRLKLDSADLRHANLRGANFARATLAGADLSYADVTGACLRGAMLMCARLRGAILIDADLSEAGLAGADLHEADLRSALLETAKLAYVHYDETTRWPDAFDPNAHGATPERMEALAQRMMASGLTPEEYAGRHGHSILVFGAARCMYRDPRVTAWMRRLGEILSDPATVARYQEQFLTRDEMDEIRRAEE